MAKNEIEHNSSDCTNSGTGEVSVNFDYFTKEDFILPASPSDPTTQYPSASNPGNPQHPQYSAPYTANPYAPASSQTPATSLSQTTAASISQLYQENDRLQKQMQAKDIDRLKKAHHARLREEAYNEVISTPAGLLSLGKDGRKHLVFALELDRCIKVTMDMLYWEPNFYYIAFKSSVKPLVIYEEGFRNPQILVQHLEAHFKKSVYPCGSKTKVYSGIQSLLSRRTEDIFLPFYSGWEKKKKSSQWEYRLLRGSTHGVRDQSISDLDLESPPVHPPMDPAVQLTAGIQFAEIMASINDDAPRHLITGIIHVSSLYSLFTGLNHRLSLGFCLFNDTPQLLEAMEALLSWFGDGGILLSETKTRFANLLIERKDQPALVWDEVAQLPNSKMLSQAIKTGVITNGKDEDKLYALPIVLSRQNTPLANSAELIRIDIPDSAVSLDMSSLVKKRYAYLMAYLQYFNMFVQEHQAEFAETLEACLDDVTKETAEYAFPKTVVEILAAFRTADRIAQLYYSSLSPHRDAAQLFENLFTDEPNTLLLESLKALCCHDTNEAIASRFFETANQLIQDNRFDIRVFGSPQTFEPCPQDKLGILYIYKNTPCFTTDAYDHIAAKTGYRPATVKQALAAVGAFKGAKTNVNSFQTRIRGFNPTTKQDFTSVYQFSGESIVLPAMYVKSTPSAFIKPPAEYGIRLDLGRSIDGDDMVWYGIDNCHACITGQSGTGKSYFLKKAITQLPGQNTRCIVFDTSGEFSRTPNAKDPEAWRSATVDVIDMRNTQVQKLFFQPLSDADTPDIIASRFTDTLTRRFKFGRNQQDFLLSATKEIVTEKEFPSFDDLLGCTLHSQVKNALERLRSLLPLGEEAFEWNFDTPGITVLNFQNGSDDAARGTALELLLSSICARQMNVPRDSYPSVVLVIDECQLLKWQEGSYANDIMTRGRKFGLAMWLSTQTLSQIKNPKIPGQANLHICFRPAEGESAQLIKAMNISGRKQREEYRDILSDLKDWQFLCKLNGQIYVSAPPDI